MSRDDIQKINEDMVLKGKDYCLHGGKMQLVYKDISLADSKWNQYDQRFLCVCPYNYIGMRCEECAKGYYGPH